MYTFTIMVHIANVYIIYLPDFIRLLGLVFVTFLLLEVLSSQVWDGFTSNYKFAGKSMTLNPKPTVYVCS